MSIVRTFFMFLCMGAVAFSSPIPQDFPSFIVPGYEHEMKSLRAMYWLYYEPAKPLIALWDEWMPMSTLWPATGKNMDQMWSDAFAERIIGSDGYVHTQQHDGLAHSEGWPFPLWTQAGGVGWHFAPVGVPGYEAPLVKPDGWEIVGGRSVEINDQGWVIELMEPDAVITTPEFFVDCHVSPWLRLNWWATGLKQADCYLEWMTNNQPEFLPENRAYFSPAASDGKEYAALPMGSKTIRIENIENREMVPVYKIPGWKDTITRIRICFANTGKARVIIKSFHTACESRHNINNSNFIRGCHDYFMWTHNIDFLRSQMERMRTAMRFIMNEFDTRERKCVYTTWPGHEGRSGVRITSDGKKIILPGEGIGSNYWDLMPFGGQDPLASIYYYDALLNLAELEEQISRHPQWCINSSANMFDPADLREHAIQVKNYGSQRFWNNETGRLGAVDLDGQFHDYGFTFLNNEAVYYNFCTPEQERLIRDWISGRRVVNGDTSVKEDIYHWRFGPRSTTKRNLDYYVWSWSEPENIPWGNQVQDGGAVFGFSYHDLMCRLLVDGPDDTWKRLQEILVWFDETQAAGGYREYYKDASRGTLQGGNVPGGLGLDKEFFECILVPQTMLYGFMGFNPTVDGFSVDPKLPTDWPELTVTRIKLHKHIINLTAADGFVKVISTETPQTPFVVNLPKGWKLEAVSPGLARLNKSE